MLRSRLFEGRTGRLAFGLVVVGIVVAGGPALAQEGEPGVRLVVEGGIDGWVDPQWPMTITARIETDILLVAELLVVQGQELARVEVEVPANGARTYEVVVAPPTDRQVVRLRVVPRGADDEESVASAFFRPRVAGEEILVGLVGVPRLGRALGEVRSAVGGVPITTVGVDNALNKLEEGELYPLSYLVLDEPRPLPAATVSWLKGGGRLVTTSSALESMGLDAEYWGTFPGVGGRVGWYGIAEGEVLALGSLSGVGPRSWARLLRPLPKPHAQQIDFRGERNFLTRAALAAGGEVPGYLWLPLVVVVYAMVVGPINLWILRRHGRLEWAWFTIPALSLVGVVALWLVSTSGVDQTFWSHGTVQVAGPASQARSSLVAATSRARTLEMSFDSGWTVFPESPEWLSGDAFQPTIEGAGVYRYELPSLGWLSVNAFRRRQSVSIDVAFSEQGVELINDSSVPVVFWGIHAFPKAAIGAGVEAGATGFLRWDRVLNAGSQWSFVDHLWEVIAKGWVETPNENWLELVADLEYSARFSGMMDVPFFVFAVTQAPFTGLAVEGRLPEVQGMTLTLFPVPAAEMGEAGWAFGRPVWSDAASRELGFGRDQVVAKQWILSYRLPRDLSTAPQLVLGGLDDPVFDGLGDSPGRLNGEEEPDEGQRPEAWDWEAAEFVSVDVNKVLDPSRFVAPSGEVLFRVSGAGLEIPAPLEGVVRWGDLP